MELSDRTYDLASTFVVVNPDLTAIPVTVTPTLFEELDSDFDGFRGRCLISCFSFDEDWPTWEIHPHGDEFVCLLSGDADMILGREHDAPRVRLDVPGAYALVPRGVWHTARIHAPSTMLFVTPGEDTENEPVGGV
jgi:mannose-6-phosphate isomerase-like protein (cupin superfamily)